MTTFVQGKQGSFTFFKVVKDEPKPVLKTHKTEDKRFIYFTLEPKPVYKEHLTQDKQFKYLTIAQ